MFKLLTFLFIFNLLISSQENEIISLQDCSEQNLNHQYKPCESNNEMKKNGFIASIKIVELENDRFLIVWTPLENVLYFRQKVLDNTIGNSITISPSFMNNTYDMPFYILYANELKIIDSIDYSFIIPKLPNQDNFQFFTYINCNNSSLRSDLVTIKLKVAENIYVNETTNTQSLFNNANIIANENSKCADYSNKRPLKQIKIQNHVDEDFLQISMFKFWDNIEYCNYTEVYQSSLLNINGSSIFSGTAPLDQKVNVYVQYGNYVTFAYINDMKTNFTISHCPLASQKKIEITSFFRCENKCIKSRTEIFSTLNGFYSYNSADPVTATIATTTTKKDCLCSNSPNQKKPSFVIFCFISFFLKFTY